MIEKNSIRFLQELAVNNNKVWLDGKTKEYESARANFLHTVATLINATAKFDAAIGQLEPGKCVFRLNRDIRFSKDKTPYKTNFGASLKMGGKKSLFAGYYLHIEPGNNSFAGGGIWHPEPDTIKKIRQEIDYNSDEFFAIIRHKNFRKQYGDLQVDDETSLKREPKEYGKDHPAIKYLKLKSWIAGRKFSDEEITAAGFVDTVSDSFRALQPLVQFLNVAVSTDKS